MTSIFGTTGFFDSDKVQNQQATPDYTNFTGVVAINGAPIYAAGGPFLPLSGGTMTGSINMSDSNAVTNTLYLNLAPQGDPVTPAANYLNIYGYSGRVKYTDDGSNQYTLATTGDLGSYLPLAGGTMSGSIDMGGQEVKNCGAFRISTANMKTIIGSSVTASGSNYTTQCGGVNTIDASSVAATSFGYGNTVTTSAGPTLLGSALTASNAFASIVIGNTCSATGCTDSVVIGHSASSTANYAHAIGYNIANSTANSLLVDCSANIRSNSTTCDLGTTAKPFQSLYISNVYSNAALNLGTSTATSVNIGRSGRAVNVNGILVAPLPKAAWYATNNVLPSFTAATFQSIALGINTSTGLVDFTIDNATGYLTYTGTQTRTFAYTCNINLSFTTASTLMVVVNKNTVVGLQNEQVAVIWDVTVTGGNRQQLTMADQIVLSTGDVVMLCARWGNTSAAQVTFGRTSFQIHALPN